MNRLDHIIRFLFILFLVGSSLLLSSTTLHSQLPGQSSFDETGFVEYIAGNQPLIISVPHGGDLLPDSIPDRDCEGCVYVKDAFTQELSRDLAEAYNERTGCFPHIVINLLHRRKFDANRDLDTAADGNDVATEAWGEYHRLIDSTKAVIAQEYGRGLFLDLHGHGHTVQRIELGYLLSGAELRLTDAELNSEVFVAESSLRTLVGDSPSSLSHAELLRGPESFGDLLVTKTYPAVPSSSDPAPLVGEEYFSGGYNTVRHGSRDNNGPIDGIQIECNQEVRFDEELREVFVDSLTTVIIEYLDFHYGRVACELTSVDTKPVQQLFSLYPNPASDYVYVQVTGTQTAIVIYNSTGRQVNPPTFKEIQSEGELYRINLDRLETGVYFVQYLDQDSGRKFTEKLVILR